jgi:hypothetical protein
MAEGTASTQAGHARIDRIIHKNPLLIPKAPPELQYGAADSYCGHAFIAHASLRMIVSS